MFVLNTCVKHLVTRHINSSLILFLKIPLLLDNGMFHVAPFSSFGLISSSSADRMETIDLEGASPEGYTIKQDQGVG